MTSVPNAKVDRRGLKRRQGPTIGETSFKTVILAAAIAAMVFAFDLMSPLGIAGGVPYVALVLFGLRFPKKSAVIYLAVAGSVLTILGYFFSPDGGIGWVILTNRTYAIVAIWVTAIVLWWAWRIETALVESELTLSTTLESVFEGVISIDEKGIIQSFNPAAEKLFGYPAKDVVGQNVSMLMPDPHRSDHDGFIQHYLQTGEARVIGNMREVTGQRKDGKKVSLELGVTEMILHQQRFFIGSLRDITERKQTQAQLIQASKLATLGEMATGMAHELNQPLNVIKMAADSAAERIEDGRFDAEFTLGKLERISAQIDRAASTIDHMRIFGRTDEVTTKLFDPVDCMIAALDLMDEQLRLHRIEVETRFSNPCRRVLGHAAQLEQVLINLIGNARDACNMNEKSPDRPGQITLAIEDTSPEPNIRLIVRDSGGGIAEDVLLRVFDPFFTTKEPGKGTGLGLSISYRIISEMGGTLEAANVGDGAEFTVSLPAV